VLFDEGNVMRLTYCFMACALAGCQSGATPSGEGNQEGSSSEIMGHSFSVRDSLYVTTSTWKSGFEGTQLVLVLSDYEQSCSGLAVQHPKANSQSIVIALANVDAAGHAEAITTPGEYPVVTDAPVASIGAARVYYQYLGPTCQVAKGFTSSGKVTVTSIGNSVVGSFDVFLENGDHATGTFHAAPCDFSQFLNGWSGCVQ
jgi:hypothetical protein